MLELNLMAAVRLDRAFIPGMIERRSGVVLHISSIAHRLPFSNSTLAYAAAKGALSTYSKGLARGVAKDGVRVTMISPGFIGEDLLGMLAELRHRTAGSPARRREVDGGRRVGNSKHRPPGRVSRCRGRPSVRWVVRTGWLQPKVR